MKSVFKKTILFFIVTLFTFTSYGQEISSGYHGYFDLGYGIGIEGTLTTNRTQITTIHGYQVNNNLFFGAGVGLYFTEGFKKDLIGGNYMWKRNNTTEVPLFADVRYNFLNKKITPFIEGRLGYNLTGSDAFWNIGAGCRFALKNKNAINVALSYESIKLKYDTLKMLVGNYFSNYYYQREDGVFCAIGLRIGYEF